MTFKTKEENLNAQQKYLSDPEKREKHRQRCLEHYYNNKEKLSAQRKLYYQRRKAQKK